MRAAVGPTLGPGVDVDIRTCRIFINGFRVLGALAADDDPEKGAVVVMVDGQMHGIGGRVVIQKPDHLPPTVRP